MTNKNSPVAHLKRQADKIAASMKDAERGKLRGVDRSKPEFVMAVFMDDKILKVTIAWATIRETEEAALSEWVLGRMQERPAPNL